MKRKGRKNVKITVVPWRVVIEFGIPAVPGKGTLVVLLSVDDARELDGGAFLQKHLGGSLHPRLLHCGAT